MPDAMPVVPQAAPAQASGSRLARQVRSLPPVKALLLGGAVGAGLVGLAWGLTAADFGGGPDTFSTTGGLILSDRDGYLSAGTGCEGKGGYKDIGAGTEVTVTDAAGKVVAAGSLGQGEIVGTACMLRFTVEGIPEGSKLYRVEVSHRGALTKTEQELREGDLAFTLGG
ncbi:hypothetical protein [Streptomyces sp. ISL-94]|uniref:hypothetical protein n=1 Tax=Streptomyces sp. ISL-94 TaxID=2819190 RepID=UPI001BEC1698|nr:hypothetical protein [Streptomyces sp. ISL-94]MBT2480341.1 hypothetical protein [Streptomyces sp. ISL-94]